MDSVPKLVGGILLFVSALLAVGIIFWPTQKQSSRPKTRAPTTSIHRSSPRDEHTEKCTRLVNGYIVWRGRNTAGDWRPLGTENIEIVSEELEGREYFVLSGTLHYRLNGSRKQSDFVCHDRNGEAEVAIVSGPLQGVAF